MEAGGSMLSKLARGWVGCVDHQQISLLHLSIVAVIAVSSDL